MMNIFYECFNKIRGSAILLAMLQFAIAASMVEASGDATITCTHKERSLQPGEAVVLQIVSSFPLKQVLINAFGREFFAFTEDGGLTWLGLVGIDLDTKPGRYKARINGIDKDGKSVASEALLEVKAKIFPTRKLTVDGKYVTPPPETLSRIEEERKRVNAIFASITAEKLWDGPFMRPVPGTIISAFGKRSVYNGQPRSAHTGVDFRGAAGTPIRAPNSGIVVLAANLYYSGNTVILDHGYGLYSYFGHMSIFFVKEGDRIKAGDRIGNVGATGVVTGPHLHWTVRLSQSRIDPLSLAFLLK
jgi:murein DD-endopeptidase MepM/ murein hydrolase activator NlpD